MLPLSVITWRLGDLNSDQFEKLIPAKDKKSQIFDQISKITGGIFFLETCQRIILVGESTKPLTINEVINSYFDIVEKKKSYELEPEVFLGIDALLYLAKVVSGLDSVVLGEYEIQHQFKEAYDESSCHMGNILTTFMQYVIRIGKRVRQEIQMNRTSTIEAVESVYHYDFQEAKSIGIIGSGKMGKLSLDYLNTYSEKIKLYSTHDQRVGDTLSGFTIESLQELDHHDILITATSRAKFIDQKFLKDHNLNRDVLLVDLGMPRNCNPDIYSNGNIEIVDIHRLVETADKSERFVQISEALGLIEHEINQIIKEYQHRKRSKSIVDLRSDLHQFVDQNKPDFIDESNDKTFSQFINALIHISQKHVEKAMFEGNLVND